CGGGIRACGDFRIKAAADEGRTDVAHALAVGGERGFAPVERDAVAFAAGAQIRRRRGEVERRRAGRAGLGTTRQQQAECGQGDELSKIYFHAERERVSEAVWARATRPRNLRPEHSF